ncbi:MAG: NusG domain II-containing protein, partial [Ignavibacteriaceae bacterium]
KGRHIGDIAYIKSRKLINYHKESDEFSRLLDESAKSLSLPRSLDDPVLLQFSSENNLLKAGNVNIFSGDVLTKQLPLDKDVDHFRVNGLKGHVDIRIKNKYVSIASATCRHKTCMNMEPISRPGQNLICIPNQINIAIAGKSALGVDSVTF